jgi:hypothetical protein
MALGRGAPCRGIAAAGSHPIGFSLPRIVLKKPIKKTVLPISSVVVLALPPLLPIGCKAGNVALAEA